MKNTRRILIVEDEFIIALMLEKMVTRQGHQVVGKVSSGEEAVQSARETTPDLILMDIRLNGQMDGIEAVKRINELKPTPVIFVTGNSDKSYQTRMKEIEYVDLLTKPVTYNELSRSVSQAS